MITSVEGAAQARGEHLSAAEFDELAESHGTPALWRRARMCPCWDGRTGQADINCALCEKGIIWDDGTETRILAFNRVRDEVYDIAGKRLQGMTFLTFPTAVTPGHYDMAELTAAEMVCNNELHKRGDVDLSGRSTERLRMPHPLEVEFCEAVINGTLAQYQFFADFTVNDERDILWNSGKGPPGGAFYTMRYRARPTWIVWAPQSRDENATKMPYSVMAQRYDFFDPKAVGEA